MTKIPMPSAGMWKSTVMEGLGATGQYYTTLQLSVASPEYGVSAMVAYALAKPDMLEDKVYEHQQFSITRDGWRELARTFGNPMGTFQTFGSKEQAERRYRELVDLAMRHLTREPVWLL
jgi:hypothetical protein